ncbi:unnamed protein product [Gemmataceae bacterium]|nr:unnamed protein product [Gemmataceae bacterium]VTT96519.1 unnamed protein product [Gemmataceae bacterium]
MPTNTFSPCTEDGYGAAGVFVGPGDVFSAVYLDIQVGPNRLKVTLPGDPGRTFSKRAVWVGHEAHAVGAALCNREMPPAVLADWLDDNDPAECDRGFRPAEMLRAA